MYNVQCHQFVCRRSGLLIAEPAFRRSFIKRRWWYGRQIVIEDTLPGETCNHKMLQREKCARPTRQGCCCCCCCGGCCCQSQMLPPLLSVLPLLPLLLLLHRPMVRWTFAAGEIIMIEEVWNRQNNYNKTYTIVWPLLFLQIGCHRINRRFHRTIRTSFIYIFRTSKTESRWKHKNLCEWPSIRRYVAAM